LLGCARNDPANEVVSYKKKSGTKKKTRSLRGSRWNRETKQSHRPSTKLT